MDSEDAVYSQARDVIEEWRAKLFDVTQVQEDHIVQAMVDFYRAGVRAATEPRRGTT